MHQVSIDEMISGKKSRYALVIGVAKRAREISQEFHDNQVISEDKPVMLAIEDFKEHKYELYEPEIND